MKTRLLLLLGIILLIAGFAVRLGNTHQATKLANAVVATDNAGTDPTSQLATLKSYVHAHMGAHAKFTLQAGYERAVASAKTAAAAQATNSQIYAAAQAACGGKTDSITQAKCNEQYLSQHLVNLPAQAPVSAPILSAYQYDLSAPFWTADTAGWLWAAALVALLAGFIGLIKRKRVR